MNVEAVVTHSYSENGEGQVTAIEGDRLNVIGDYGDGWCEVSFKGNQGIFPTAYLSFINGKPPIIEEKDEAIVTENFQGLSFEADPTWYGFEDAEYTIPSEEIQPASSLPELETTNIKQEPDSDILLDIEESVSQPKQFEAKSLLSMDGPAVEIENQGAVLEVKEEEHLKVEEPIQSSIETDTKHDVVISTQQLELGLDNSGTGSVTDKDDTVLVDAIDDLVDINEISRDDVIESSYLPEAVVAEDPVIVNLDTNVTEEVQRLKDKISKIKEEASAKEKTIEKKAKAEVLVLKAKLAKQQSNFKAMIKDIKEKCKEKIREYVRKEREETQSIRVQNTKLNKELSKVQTQFALLKGRVVELTNKYKNLQNENSNVQGKTQTLNIENLEALKDENKKLRLKLREAKDFYDKARVEFKKKNRTIKQLKTENRNLRDGATAVESPKEGVEVLKKENTLKRPTAPGSVQQSNPFISLHL